MYDGAVFTWTQGAVADVLGRGIEGAFLREDQAPSEYTWSDYRGDYELRIWAHCPTTITATHPRFDSVTSEQVGLATPFVGPQFRLLYQIKAPSASPQAINPSPTKSISFEVPAGPLTLAEAQVRLQLPTGETLDLQPDGYAGSLGRWTGSWTPPESLADGVYSYKACVVSPGAAGNCDAVSSGALMSLITSGSFTVDRVAPSIPSVAPGNNRTALKRKPLIGSTAASDAGSGIDYGNSGVYLNGALVSDGRPYRPNADLPLGKHSAEVVLRDYAGNASALGWAFTVATLSAEAASATVRKATATVQAAGLGHKATFSGVEVDMEKFSLSLSSSDTGFGKGAVRRTVPLENLVVDFYNAVGAFPQTVSLNSLLFESSWAVLAPDQNQQRGTIPRAIRKVPTFDVDAPPGFFMTQGSYAVLKEVLKPAGAITSVTLPPDQYEWLDPFPYSVDCDAGGCSVTGVLTCDISSRDVSGCNGTGPEVLLRHGDGSKTPLLGSTHTLRQLETGTPLGQYSRTSLAAKIPSRVCNPSCTNLAFPGSITPGDRYVSYWSAGELYSVFGHQYAYGAPTSAPSIAVWQSADVRPGISGGLFACSSEFGNAVEAGGSWSPSLLAPTVNPKDENQTIEKYGVPQLSGTGFVVKPQTDNGVPYKDQRENGDENGLFLGNYDSKSGQTIVQTSAGAAKVDSTKGTWNTVTPGNGRKSAQTEIMTGTALAGGSLDQYSILTRLVFEFDLVPRGCQ